MSGKHFVAAETIVEDIDSKSVDEDGKGRFGYRSGMNLVFRSAVLRMTLVGTSTVVAVTSIAFLTIGTCELSNTQAPNGNEALVLVTGGVILLIASFFQFLTVGVLSGWCNMWAGARRSEREIHLLPPNQFLINGQMVNVKAPSSSTGDNSLVSPSGYDFLEPNLQVIPEEEAEHFARTVVTRYERPRLEVTEGMGKSHHGIIDAGKVDATTSTRGEMVYFPIRGYAPLALQEEITPSLRSSFQSFDELA